MIDQLESLVLRNMTLDMEPGEPAPKAGEFLASDGRRGIGSYYLVESARKMKSKYPNRFALTMRLVDKPAGDCRIVLFHWYPRKRKCLLQHSSRMC